MIRERSVRSVGISLLLTAMLASCGGSGGDNNSSGSAASGSVDANAGRESTPTTPTGSDDGSSGDPIVLEPIQPTGPTFDELLATSAEPNAFGTVLDSAVSGLRYKSGDHYGITDSDGTFGYIEGETVEFFIGDITIGAPIPPAARITPYEMARGDEQTALNIASFLQTLDNDADSDNGIQINDAVHTLAAGAAVDFSSAGWLTPVLEIYLDGSPPHSRRPDIDLLVFELTSATEAGARYMVSEDTAYAHLYFTFHDVIRTLGSDVKSVAEASTCQVDSHCKRFQLSNPTPYYACTHSTSLLYSEYDADIETMGRLAVDRDSLIDITGNLYYFARDPNWRESSLCITRVTLSRDICGESNHCEVTTSLWD